VDRLIALVLLRWRLDLRGMRRARGRAVGFLVLVPGLLVFSVFGAALAFLGLRSLAAGDEDALLPILSLLATMVGLFWVLSPLVAGLALTESHDVSRLLHFPIPVGTLVASSLIANLSQPLVLAEVPLVAAVALAVTDRLAWFPLALAGVLVTFGVILAATQVSGLVLHGLSRNRRLHDLSMFFGIGVGFLLSFLPILLLWGGMRPLLAVARGVRGSDVFALSPFAWGVRAAVHGGRGDLAGFAVYAAAGLLAIGAAMAASGLLIRRISRGELDLGATAASRGRPARMFLPGSLGALVEKDLRVAWRDPALKAGLFLGVVGPLLFLAFMVQGGGARGGRGLLYLAMFIGIQAFGNNAFGLERRAVALLLGFPVPRWRILVGKNLGAMAFRVPALLTMLVAGLLLAPLVYLPAAAVLALIAMVIAAGVDNYVSILMPAHVPPPGQNPYGGTAGTRGLAAAFLSLAMMFAAFLIASPFVLLAWLPLLLEEPAWWLASLPLGLAGALAVYAMLIAGAARLLEQRETDLLERILTESEA
jgi:ABC-2 type transport system permease protein